MSFKLNHPQLVYDAQIIFNGSGGHFNSSFLPLGRIVFFIRALNSSNVIFMRPT